MSSAPAVTVVVPNWNGAAVLGPLLAALAAQTFTDFETVVIDNASDDGSPALVKRDARVRLIELASNTGFTGAVNRGLAAARADLILLLNNDMAPRPGFVAALVAAADAHPEAGSLACRVLSRADPGRIDSAGDRIGRSGRARAIGRGEPDGARFDAPGWVFGGTGGAVLFRRQVLAELGGFDDDFFLYVEDTDVAFRAQLAGWRCRYVPEAVTEHVGSQSLAGREDVRARYCLRNYLYFLLKDWPLRWLVADPGAVLRQVAREARFAFTATRVRHGGRHALAAIGRVLAQVVWRAPRMLVKRARLERRAGLARLRVELLP